MYPGRPRRNHGGAPDVDSEFTCFRRVGPELTCLARDRRKHATQIGCWISCLDYLGPPRGGVFMPVGSDGEMNPQSTWVACFRRSLATPANLARHAESMEQPANSTPTQLTRNSQ